MKEWTQQELREHAESGVKPFAVFLYTPFCGTCKLTERMLSIILTMEPEMPIFKSNVNFMPQMIQDWQITSVPCIVIIEAGKEMKRIYNMKSVDYLYDELKPLREIKTEE